MCSSTWNSDGLSCQYPQTCFSQTMTAATHTKKISSLPVNENFTSTVFCPGKQYKSTLFSDQVLCFWGNICLKGGMDSQLSSIIWISNYNRLIGRNDPAVTRVHLCRIWFICVPHAHVLSYLRAGFEAKMLMEILSSDSVDLRPNTLRLFTYRSL